MLKELRQSYKPALPRLLTQINSVTFDAAEKLPVQEEIRQLFPKTSDQPVMKGSYGTQRLIPALKVGVVFSGGPASGGHNVIAGLFDAGCQLIGFLNGPEGIVEGKSVRLTAEKVGAYRNLGGFDLIGTGRLKIETEDQLQAALKAVIGLDGLVIIGGDDSNTNAAVIAEYFLTHNCPTKVIGVPKTIDGDVQNPYVPISFGFDTATKIYAEMIGNIALDAVSSRKYTHFIKLMGRSASHITLECGLKTHPNLTLISEENQTLPQITTRIADLIEKRKSYGVILIPEGLIQNLPMPQHALDPHGNVNLSAIETEALLIQSVTDELKRRKFTGKFSGVPHFFGYEGRCGFPSNFDANYCYALGLVAALLIMHRQTSMMAFVSNLTAPVAEWTIGGLPLTTQMLMEERGGKKKPLIQKTYVDLNGKPYKKLQKSWELIDDYQIPGPMQFDDSIPLILQ